MLLEKLFILKYVKNKKEKIIWCHWIYKQKSKNIGKNQNFNSEETQNTAKKISLFFS